MCILQAVSKEAFQNLLVKNQQKAKQFPKMLFSLNKLALGALATVAVVNTDFSSTFALAKPEGKVAKKGKKGGKKGKKGKKGKSGMGMPGMDDLLGGLGGLGGMGGMPGMEGIADMFGGPEKMQEMIAAMGGEDGIKKMMENFGGEGGMPDLGNMDMDKMNKAMEGIDKDKLTEMGEKMGLGDKMDGKMPDMDAMDEMLKNLKDDKPKKKTAKKAAAKKAAKATAEVDADGEVHHDEL